MNHTPTPLTIKKGAFVNIVCPRGAVCEMTAGYDQTRLHDAQFIVRACNAHEELVAALKAMISTWDCYLSNPSGYPAYQKAKKVLTTIEKGA